MPKRLIISEEEKNKILKLYGLKSNFINEEDTPKQGNKKTIEVPVYFESGCWSNTGGESCASGQVDTAFQPYIQQIKDYVTNYFANKQHLYEQYITIFSLTYEYFTNNP